MKVTGPAVLALSKWHFVVICPEMAAASETFEVTRFSEGFPGLAGATSLRKLFTATEQIVDLKMRVHSVSLYTDFFRPERQKCVLNFHRGPGMIRPEIDRRPFSPLPDFLRLHTGVQSFNLRQIFPERGGFERSSFFRRVAIDEGWRTFVGLAAWDSGDLDWLMIVRRGADHGEFSPHDLAWLGELRSRFQSAFHRLRERAAESALRRSLSSCLDLSPTGVMVFARDGALQYRNSSSTKACVDWVHGPGSAGRLKWEEAFAVPHEITAAVREMVDLPSFETRILAPPPALARTVKIQPICAPEFEHEVASVLVQIVPLSSQFSDFPGTADDLALTKLTIREIEVVRLAAQYHTNRTIGSLLRKSERTVAAQVSSSMAKLGLTSRMQFAELFDRR